MYSVAVTSAFSTSCVFKKFHFGERFRGEKVRLRFRFRFSSFTLYVWTETLSTKEKLGFQTKTNKWWRSPILRLTSPWKCAGNRYHPGTGQNNHRATCFPFGQNVRFQIRKTLRFKWKGFFDPFEEFRFSSTLAVSLVDPDNSMVAQEAKKMDVALQTILRGNCNFVDKRQKWLDSRFIAVLPEI